MPYGDKHDRPLVCLMAHVVLGFTILFLAIVSVESPGDLAWILWGFAISVLVWRSAVIAVHFWRENW